MISKMKRPEEGGSRLAIVFNGSPLFPGAAGSGESEIRRWIIENDWLEAVVALPDQLFYNTGISTYFWIVTNRKSPERQGNVQLIDARESWTKMRKSLGEKRKQISMDQIADIVRLYGDFEEDDHCRILPNEAFGFMRITVERPLRLRWEVTDSTLAVLETDKKVAKLDDGPRREMLDTVRGWQGMVFEKVDELRNHVVEDLRLLGVKGKTPADAILSALAVRDSDALVITDKKGNVEPDSELRDNENVPLPTEPRVVYEQDPTERLASAPYADAVDSYVEAEVLPYVPDAWVDHSKTRIGYEIPLTRHFYRFEPPRPLAEIDSEIQALEAEIQGLLHELST